MAAPVIYKNLTDLFNLSITSGVFPSDWKTAKVSPLFKSGDLTDANNYRQISVLPTTARVFENLYLTSYIRMLMRKTSFIPTSPDLDLFIQPLLPYLIYLMNGVLILIKAWLMQFFSWT